jgi:hypothetical protein
MARGDPSTDPTLMLLVALGAGGMGLRRVRSKA